MPDLSATIEDLAKAPASVTVDGQGHSEQSLADVMAADRYLARKAAIAASGHGLHLARIVHRSDYDQQRTYSTSRWYP